MSLGPRVPPAVGNGRIARLVFNFEMLVWTPYIYWILCESHLSLESVSIIREGMCRVKKLMIVFVLVATGILTCCIGDPVLRSNLAVTYETWFGPGTPVAEGAECGCGKETDAKASPLLKS